MKRPLLASAVIFVLLSVTNAALATSAETFDEIMKPYEEIRLTLLKDSVEGISERAEAIRGAAEEAARAAATAEDVRPLLDKISKSSEELARAQRIEGSRAAFYEISKTLVRYRAMVESDDLPVVMYCPMAKKSWLQLEDEVGNPYHGQFMPSCGDAVREK